MSDSEYEVPSVVSEAPPKKKPRSPTATATKRKATTAAKRDSSPAPYQIATSHRANKKKDLFHILQSEEAVNNIPKNSSGTATSSFTSRVSTGSSRRTAPSSGEFFVDLKVYKTKEYASTPIDVRYKKALVAVKLQCDDESPSWEALQAYLAKAWALFEESEPVHYSDKINFK